jgi:anti-sigma factor RsiW
MNCGDINELGPLWHSGELDASRQCAFDAHVAVCPDCATEIRDQWTNDARLRDAIAEEPADTRAVGRRVMRRIARERLRRWLMPAMAAAAAVVATVFLLTSQRQAPASPVFATIFADAARDHTVEIVKGAPRRWRTDAADIAALEVTQGISDSDVKALEATGYKLERAKVCRLSGTPYMHLVYTKGGREFSVFMRVRGAQPVPEAASSSGNLQLATFTRGRVQAIVVTDAPRGDCARFAHDAEAAL